MAAIVDGIALVSVPVTDQQRSRRFFVEQLGFDLLQDEPFQGEMRWIEVAPAASQTRFTLVTWFEHMPPGSMRGCVLSTSDLDSAHAELRRRGVAIDDIEQRPWGRYATFSDPDGNGFVLQQFGG